MAEKRKIDFEVKDFDRVEMDLDDFKWLITSLYDSCNDVGCIPSMYSIDAADKILEVIYENKLNLYIDLGE